MISSDPPSIAPQSVDKMVCDVFKDNSLLNRPEKKVEEKKVQVSGQIMVADDSALNLKVTKSILGDIGVIEQCSFYTNGQEAIDSATSVVRTALDHYSSRGIAKQELRPITAMLLDLQMPLKNGL